MLFRLRYNADSEFKVAGQVFFSSPFYLLIDLSKVWNRHHCTVYYNSVAHASADLMRWNQPVVVLQWHTILEHSQARMQEISK